MRTRPAGEDRKFDRTRGLLLNILFVHRQHQRRLFKKFTHARTRAHAHTSNVEMISTYENKPVKVAGSPDVMPGC